MMHPRVQAIKKLYESLKIGFSFSSGMLEDIQFLLGYIEELEGAVKYKSCLGCNTRIIQDPDAWKPEYYCSYCKETLDSRLISFSPCDICGEVSTTGAVAEVHFMYCGEK